MTSKLKNSPSSGLNSLFERGLLWSSQTADIEQRALKTPGIKTSAANIRGEQNYDPPLVASFGLDLLDKALPAFGLPFGQVHEFAFELSDSLKQKRLHTPFWILSWLIACSERQNNVATSCASSGRHLCIWIDSQCWPTPHTLEHVYQHPNWRTYSFFLDPKDSKERLWSIVEAARQKCVFAIIANASGFSPNAYRKLQLAIEKGGGIALLIRRPEELKLPSPAYSRWAVSPFAHDGQQAAWSMTLKKIKGTTSLGVAPPHRWNIYWDSQTQKMKLISKTKLSNTTGLMQETAITA